MFEPGRWPPDSTRTVGNCGARFFSHTGVSFARIPQKKEGVAGGQTTPSFPLWRSVASHCAPPRSTGVPAQPLWLNSSRRAGARSRFHKLIPPPRGTHGSEPPYCVPARGSLHDPLTPRTFTTIRASRDHQWRRLYRASFRSPMSAPRRESRRHFFRVSGKRRVRLARAEARTLPLA